MLAFFRNRKKRNRAFSLIELTVTSGLVVSFFGAAALIYRVISSNQKRLAKFGAVDITANKALNFYGLTTSSKDVYWAPNYGTGARADSMRDLFYEDIQHASAVYCLARANENSIRPTTIDLTGPKRGTDIDTPGKFLAILDEDFPTASDTFTDYRGVPSSSEPNATIFLLQPSSSETELWVWSIWEIDMVPITNPETGTYVSVRRYVNSTLTRVYDVFFASGNNTSTFGPPMALFELDNRMGLVEGSAIDRFKKAPRQPFYYIWWPDPSNPLFEVGANAATYGTSDPRAAYAMHEGQTSYFFVVPMFPSLQ